MIDNTIFYLIGHAGVGKLTVAREVARLTGARIVDNHTVNNPIFSLIELGGPKPLPAAVWDRTDEVRRTVLETIATLSPPGWSFVFTHVALDDAPDIAVYHAIRETARRRGAHFQPARLTCETEEHCRRIAAPERRAQFKDTRPENARRSATIPLLTFEEPAALDLDVTHRPPAETARLIVDTARAGRG